MAIEQFRKTLSEWEVEDEFRNLAPTGWGLFTVKRGNQRIVSVFPLPFIGVTFCIRREQDG